jgi:hypothetical protein
MIQANPTPLAPPEDGAVWTTLNGREIKVADMEDSHLLNSILMVLRNTRNLLKLHIRSAGERRITVAEELFSPKDVPVDNVKWLINALEASNLVKTSALIQEWYRRGFDSDDIEAVFIKRDLIPESRVQEVGFE